ncbi:hypothetical protein ATI02_1115 [Pseudomonas baetica]|uniref:Uncharacterized protein n=1 Tax=Pseudomonas baetica TaxID=674054 RepID=A0ABX4PY00_9PSED|nr:hypothetical protein ATI02_1115 [Pseudomonas baetica]
MFSKKNQNAYIVKRGGVRNFVFGHNMSKRCMYANQKETPA